jgi:DNA-binding XRE family transcriptional regulator
VTDFVERLKKAAAYAGAGESQANIAEAIGVTRQTVNRWFTKDGEPGVDLTFTIARKFRVSAEWLKWGGGEMLPPPSDGLLQDEKELIRYYRSATPEVREVIIAWLRRSAAGAR